MAEKTTSPKKSTRAERLRQAARERRAREKQALRQTIIDAAEELFLEYGYEGFSLRHVAERIGYSPGTIYLHFADKDALLFTLCYEGFVAFGNALQTAYDSTDDVAERVRLLGETYIKFALDNQANYQLMFMQRADFLTDKQLEGVEPPISSFDILQKAVAEAIEAGLIRQGEVRLTSSVIWAAIHGACALAISMGPHFGEEHQAEIFEAVLQLIGDGLKAT